MNNPDYLPERTIVTGWEMFRCSGVLNKFLKAPQRLAVVYDLAEKRVTKPKTDQVK